MTPHLFSSSPIFILADIDDCSDNSHDCDPLATCINSNGSFKCDCKEGYYGDGKSCSGKFEDLVLTNAKKKNVELKLDYI